MLKHLLQRIPTILQPTSYIRTNPYFTSSVTQIPTNTYNLQSNNSQTNYQTTHPPTKPITTVSNPTYINFSASISEPVKRFDGLDHKYTSIHLKKINNKLKPVSPFHKDSNLQLLRNTNFVTQK